MYGKSSNLVTPKGTPLIEVEERHFLAIIVCICVLNIKREFMDLIHMRPAKHNDSDKSKNYSIITNLNKGSPQ